jgi:hypothetical protein
MKIINQIIRYSEEHRLVRIPLCIVATALLLFAIIFSFIDYGRDYGRRS